MTYMTGAGKGIDKSKIPKKFFYLRHCKTRHNVEKAVDINGEPHWPAQGGGTDEPLDETGMQQARQIHPKLSGLGVDKIFCSPQIRAIQTVNPDGCDALETTILVYLKERGFGDFEVGLDPTRVMPAKNFRENFSRGEDLEPFYKRIVAGLSEGSPYQLPLFVGHGKFLDGAAEICCGKDLPPECRKNGTLIFFEQKPGSDWWTVKLA